MPTAQKHFSSTKSEADRNGGRTKDELRRDRITATVTLVIFALLMALLIWLASLGNGTVETLP